MHDPVLHRFISYLAEKKMEQEKSPQLHVKIELSRKFIAEVRAAFREKILDGERHLHMLAQSLAFALFQKEFELHSNVIGVLPEDDGSERPFLIRERINRETLLSVLDIDLGNQMLDNFRYNLNGNWVPLQLSANFVEYIPISNPGNSVNRLTSRVKAEEEIWNKVTDEIFQVDQLVSREKHLREFSKYVKDIFGLKIVCDDDVTCVKVHEQLKDLEISYLGSEREGSHESLVFIETKDYLTCPPEQMKRTGWKAIKSVVLFQERLFEIQVQPLANYYLELDHMSGPSHSSFKLKRDDLRDEIARLLPLYGFYRELLKMLFQGTDVSFDCALASVVITDDD